MNNKIIIPLSIAIGTGIALYKVFKQKRVKSFVAPDGNSYKPDSNYLSSDQKLYRNGKEIKLNIPDDYSSQTHNSIPEKAFSNGGNVDKNQISNTPYHHKGVRNH